jgi:hypothetical protein
LRILILGGTGFTGPFQVKYALERGHKVTVFNRGKTHPGEVPNEVEQLVGDRNGQLDALKNRKWDVAIDNPTSVPVWVRDVGQILKGNVDRYVFISTISVYGDTSKANIGEDAPLVIHNAGFDHNFLCAELKRAERALIGRERLVDTLALARRKHSAGPYSLDALCVRYGVDNSRRTKHGALLDAEILAEVYLELIGGRQAVLGLAELTARAAGGPDSIALRIRPVALPPRISDAERAAHREFIASLGEESLWRQYGGEA